MLVLKDYQRRALDALGDYFAEVAGLADNDAPTVRQRAAAFAYETVTAETLGRTIPYRDVGESQSLPELRGLPYVCVRIPTGGGKTVVAAHAPALAFDRLLGVERGVVLWLVPSTAILQQTLAALQDRDHPYRQALAAGVGPVEVVDVDGALGLSRAALESGTVVIVSTLQSFKASDTTGRRVYAENGAFLDAVKALPPGVSGGLDTYADGKPVPSLANVVRARRPVVIVDEAHNARTDLSFETLARLAPSCVIEFTATPDHEAAPSNVLFQASAAELKAEHMIKLPLALTVRPQWQAVIDDGLARRADLERVAVTEQASGGRYIRPILLIQAESRSSTRETADVDVIREHLREINVPDAWVRMATGSEWELDGEDLLSPDSAVRVLITVQALREGWDCPFAYVLATVSNVSTATAVEQLVGRVLRMPYTEPKQSPALGKAYVVAASPAFETTLRGLTDALVGAGFQREEATTLIQAALPASRQGRLDDAPGGSLGLFDQLDPMASVRAVDVPMPAADVPADLPVGVGYEPARQSLRVPVGITPEDQAVLASALPAPAAATLAAALAPHRAPAERGEKIVVPYLALRDGDLFEPFELSHVIETAVGSWSLDDCDAALDTYTPHAGQVRGAEIDATEAGRIVTTSFVPQVQSQVSLFTRDLGWNEAELARWLDRRLEAPDVRPSERQRFLGRVVLGLARDHDLEALVRDRSHLSRVVNARVATLRQQARGQAFQMFLDGDGPGDLVVSPDAAFEFPPAAAYPRLYDGPHRFQHHYYPEVGSLDTKEETDCAVFIDNLDAVDTWVRNPSTNPRFGFWLQTSTARFYPDFVCRLKDDRVLVVEYKGGHLYNDAAEKRVVGDLWAGRSEGACLFKMPRPESYQDEILALLA